MNYGYVQQSYTDAPHHLWNFLIRLTDGYRRSEDGSIRYGDRFKPYEEKVKEMLKWRLLLKNRCFFSA